MTGCTGFVAMEYYWLILNRTFVVFVCPGGLYGWKALGIVSGGGDSRFYEPLASVLEDPEVMGDAETIKELAGKRGGFFIPQSNVASVEFVKKRKWGMAAIRHSGLLYVRLADGTSREFILLGEADGQKIVGEILGSA